METTRKVLSWDICRVVPVDIVDIQYTTHGHEVVVPVGVHTDDQVHCLNGRSLPVA
jgi:hypothetical protein